MSVNSYKQLIATIDDFANQHMQIQRFKAEFQEQLPNFSNTSEAFPILFMTPVGTQFLTNIDRYTVRFYCFDLIQRDRENINTILSDTNLILNDLKKWFSEGDNDQFLIENEPILLRFWWTNPINLVVLDCPLKQSYWLGKMIPMEELEKVVFSLPSETDIQKCDRALIAFVLLTGVRDGTLKGFKLKHINLEKELLHQDPKEVETKFSKEIYTFFFPV
jgi:hypothetical protein